MISTEKKEIRQEIKKILAEYKQNFEKDSELITNKIISSIQYKTANTILSYMALQDEVNISNKLLYKEKKLYIPKVKMDTTEMDFYKYTSTSLLKTGSYNIQEPSEKEELFTIKNYTAYGKILVLIPGRAFTKDGKRLGRGKGYYDRFLSELLQTVPKKNIILAGVCFPPQILPNLPTDKYDIKLDTIFTL